MTANRIPSDRNPFKMPQEIRDYPKLYRSLIRPIREADYQDGKQFVKRFYTGIELEHNNLADMIAAIWDTQSPETCPAAYCWFQ
jgi:hypothetical protein